VERDEIQSGRGKGREEWKGMRYRAGETGGGVERDEKPSGRDRRGSGKG
jgi:hypothetical protein